MLFATQHEQLEAVRELLSHIPDPEIPVITIAELGILRELRLADDEVIEVVITPTYNGCPAMHQIEDDIKAVLDAKHITHRIITTLTPAWTTDWMTSAAKDKLRDYGIAPPCTQIKSQILGIDAIEKPLIISAKTMISIPVPCPLCSSMDTTETSHFGSTACKALYKCLACMEPFDYFKPY
jgi:ring-1,2-phenylacetyl-CoA epoxidase subunit PaaD